MSRVAVVGAGIAGLTAALRLAEQPGLQVTLYERSDRVGGKLRSGELAGATLDVGAESVLARRPEAVDLMRTVGAGERVTHPAAVPAAIVHAGTRHPLPKGTVMGVPSDPDSALGLLSAEQVERMRREPTTVLDQPDIAIGRLVEDRLGPAVTDLLVEPLLAGVYAGDSRAISARAAVPALLEAARAGRSLVQAAAAAMAAASAGAATVQGAGQGADTRPAPVFASLVGGLGSLPGMVEQAAVRAGVQVCRDTTVRDLRRCGARWRLTTGPTTAEQHDEIDAVVLATPAPASARLLQSVAPATSAELAAVEYASMALVTYAFEGRPEVFAGSSGFLVPPTEPLSVKASTFSSSKWPWLAQAGPGLTFVRVSFGRHGDVRLLQHPDDALARLGLQDLRTVLGAGVPEPVEHRVDRWGGGLPQYAVGHVERVERARESLPGGIVLCGAAYDGVGIPACVASAGAAARSVLTHLGGPA